MNDTHNFVSEWIESSGPQRCRSDSHLRRLTDEPISRQTTRSAPEMSYMRDADGFMAPWIPASASSRAHQADTDADSVAPSDLSASSRSSARSLVEEPSYRSRNLAANNIHMRPLRAQYPEPIADLVDYMRRDRDSPGPSLEEISQDADLNELWMGTEETEVEKYFRDTIFLTTGANDSLRRADRQPMTEHTVPATGSNLKVSTPVPGMLCGCNDSKAFSQQQPQLISMGMQMRATNQIQSLLYPFFVIEFKGDGGSMWAATNRCLGGAASCVNIAERLNAQLRNCSSDKVQPIGSATFSIAMNGTEARLYISWKHDELNYHMANVESFLLHRPADFVDFRRYVRNIIDWGKDTRLKEIRHSLDVLLDESRKKASADA